MYLTERFNRVSSPDAIVHHLHAYAPVTVYCSNRMKNRLQNIFGSGRPGYWAGHQILQNHPKPTFIHSFIHSVSQSVSQSVSRTLRTYIHTYTYITYIYIHTYIHNIHTYITYIHTHTYIHTYIHTYKQTYIHTLYHLSCYVH